LTPDVNIVTVVTIRITNTDFAMAKRKFNKLTKEQRRVLWSPSEENAGACWNATGASEERRRNRYPNRERDTTKPIDKEFV
jgi:hypothetical protein